VVTRKKKKPAGQIAAARTRPETGVRQLPTTIQKAARFRTTRPAVVKQVADASRVLRRDKNSCLLRPDCARAYHPGPLRPTGGLTTTSDVQVSTIWGRWYRPCPYSRHTYNAGDVP